jgi:hypothetical protein
MNPDKTRLASGQKNHMGYVADVIVWDITVRRQGCWRVSAGCTREV